MAHPGRMVTVTVSAQESFQRIDGFGVNINARYFDQRLMPAMHLLLDDLGATLYRVDIWGKSNWIDPAGTLGPAALEKARLAEIYNGEVFRRGWGMMRWLNEHGIQPYLTTSGDVPTWMLGPDGKTLEDYESFTEMLVSMIEWARKQEGLDFRLFGPLNETDLGSPEGPTVDPSGYAKVCELLVDKLCARGLEDIQLVVAEQGRFDPSYLQALTSSPKLLGHIGVFGMHDYWDIPPALYQEVTDMVKNSRYAGTPIWMTEYGDLEQTGEREWYVAWVMTSRLFDQLQAGFNGSMVWDAYDNYHDHDEHWTIYGLLRTGLRTYTPKKRYHASKHVFRFVRPGFERLAVDSQSPEVRVLAFAEPTREQVTIVGMNDSPVPARLNVQLQGVRDTLRQGSITYYRTSETENCAIAGQAAVQGRSWPFSGIDVLVPPASIFTLTNVS